MANRPPFTTTIDTLTPSRYPDFLIVALISRAVESICVNLKLDEESYFKLFYSSLPGGFCY